MIWLVLFVLICLAIVYGLFFLMFKLIWLLCKSKRNVWPHILAGVSTVLLSLLTLLAMYQAYQHFAQPLQPIIQAATQRTQPVYGAQLYTAPDNEFTFILYDGMVMSDWISIPPNNLLVGLDTNAFVTPKQPGEQNVSFSGLVLIKQPLQKDQDAPSLVKQLMDQLEQVPAAQGSIELDDDPEPIQVGDENPGFLLTGTIYPNSSQQELPASVIVATHNNYSYLLFAIGNDPQAATWDTLRSFRFAAN